MAPKPINAPAKIPSITIEITGNLAFCTPKFSTRSAISLGEKASKP